MHFLLSTTILLFVLISQSECEEDKELETFLQALDDPKIVTVGILLSAYSNSHLPKKAWAKCEYCTQCPNLQEPFPDTAPQNNSFVPCPKRVAILAENVKHEHDYIQDVWDRYTSEFMSFCEDEVFILRRVHSRNGKMRPISEEQILSSEMNVTTSRLKLDKVDFDAVVKPSKDASGKGEDVTWNKLSFEDPIMGPRLKFGDASFQGWQGMATETTALWPIKDEKPRKTVLLYLLELLELRDLGCACIKKLLGSQFSGTTQDLVDICRASLKIETEELRPAIRLSTCLSPEEEKELRNKKNLKDEELSLHNEL
ncbi:uncharacterized protein LOC118435133 isoform X2 [Folsomia candida]|uniref:Uncharacterized protein n=1 Tax=Folsomia candida TaxID=158441 RepID=A0A226F1U3_FOLCA|nr:uncharacterized protein LOC118435133 isoform X2 [Folsomia candida]OXA63749.1 hypothetical protein Fcan01_03166 [Folsomia candida]